LSPVDCLKPINLARYLFSELTNICHAINTSAVGRTTSSSSTPIKMGGNTKIYAKDDDRSESMVAPESQVAPPPSFSNLYEAKKEPLSPPTLRTRRLQSQLVEKPASLPSFSTKRPLDAAYLLPSTPQIGPISLPRSSMIINSLPSQSTEKFSEAGCVSDSSSLQSFDSQVSTSLREQRRFSSRTTIDVADTEKTTLMDVESPALNHEAVSLEIIGSSLCICLPSTIKASIRSFHSQRCESKTIRKQTAPSTGCTIRRSWTKTRDSRGNLGSRGYFGF